MNPLDLLLDSIHAGVLHIHSTFRRADNTPVNLIYVEVTDGRDTWLRPVAELIDDPKNYHELPETEH